jgi:hypothetical protein
MSGTVIADPRSLPRAAADGSRWLTVAAWVVLPCLMLLPLGLAGVPGLVDYPNHLARSAILADAGHSPDMAANYAVHWRVIGDLAMDLVVPPLAGFMPVELAGRVFVGLVMASLIGGTAVLHKAVWGRVGAWPLCCLLFLYNADLHWGFVDCLAGIGMFLFAFAGWIASRRWPLRRRVAVFAPVAAGLFLLHLFAFGLYGLAVTTYEFGLRWRRRRPCAEDVRALCLVALQFVPGLLLWYLSFHNGEATYTQYGNWRSKLYALVSPVVFAGRPTLLDCAFVVAIGVAAVFAISRRWLRCKPEMRLPLTAMLATAALMPNFLTGSWAADIRLPVALSFIAVACFTPRLPDRRLRVGLAAAALSLLAARVACVSVAWQDFDANLREFRAAAQAIPRGARLLVVEEAPLPGQAGGIAAMPIAPVRHDYASYVHLPAFAVIDRAAFIPYLFTQWKTVEVAARNRALADGGWSPISPYSLRRAVGAAAYDAASEQRERAHHFGTTYWADWPHAFDYVLWIDFDRGFQPTPHLQPVAAGSYFRIYRVSPTG